MFVSESDMNVYFQVIWWFLPQNVGPKTAHVRVVLRKRRDLSTDIFAKKRAIFVNFQGFLRSPKIWWTLAYKVLKLYACWPNAYPLNYAPHVRNWSETDFIENALSSFEI